MTRQKPKTLHATSRKLLDKFDKAAQEYALEDEIGWDDRDVEKSHQEYLNAKLKLEKRILMLEQRLAHARTR